MGFVHNTPHIVDKFRLLVGLDLGEWQTAAYGILGSGSWKCGYWAFLTEPL